MELAKAPAGTAVEADCSLCPDPLPPLSPEHSLMSISESTSQGIYNSDQFGQITLVEVAWMVHRGLLVWGPKTLQVHGSGVRPAQDALPDAAQVLERNSAVLHHRVLPCGLLMFEAHQSLALLCRLSPTELSPL